MINEDAGGTPARGDDAAAAPFRSFWQAGYEGADHVNHALQALSMNAATGHAERVRADYALLAEFGIRTVRESVGWRLVEVDGRFDFSSLEERARVAQEMGLQICWTFCHYGWPPDLDVFAPEFVSRFARLCGALAAYLAPYSDNPPIYSPINEISFTSWGLSVHLFHCTNRDHPDAGNAGKRQLVRATIAGCDAIWQVDPRARILQCDPVIHIVAPVDRPDWDASAAGWRSSQFEAWDMLCGRSAPELGGAPRYLDLIGANYYHSNQWESGTNLRLWWHLANPRRMPLHTLLAELWQRYQRPLLLAETSHVGSGRGDWIREMAEQAALAMQHGVDFRGICLYPVIDRPDWEDENHWHKSGLWDIDRSGPDPLARVLSQPYGMALQQARELTAHLCSTHHALSGRKEISMPTLLVFSHLRWNFVYQRPQHLLSRLAQHYKVVFLEEPVFTEGESFLDASTPAPNVTVYTPHTPVRASGFHDDQIPLLQTLLEQIVAKDEHPIAWFYTPMALPLLQHLQPSLVVYDCMDELAAFSNPPKQLLQRETALLGIADLVFTGGPSLFEAKRKRHGNAHCFPSSVDVVHFEQALDRANGHPAQADIPRPRLGFYGVIDERFDAGLIAALADADPRWQIVLVGPIIKIDPAALPQRENLHYLGQQPYQALPHFLAGWDACLLPFARNEATRFISPTKVLEYMAAELPIISTAIPDVETLYGEAVTVARDQASFIAACAAALALTPGQNTGLVAQMRNLVAATSWDGTARQMHQLLQNTPPGHHHERLTPPGSAGVAGAASAVGAAGGADLPPKINPLRSQPGIQQVQCLIAGAGPTGLSAAYHYGKDALLLDRNPTVGGWCRSVQEQGFTFDHAGHIMFSNDPYVLALYDKLLGTNMHWQNREAWVYSKDVYTRYPFQGALYGLPPAVIKECIVGAIEARFGTAKKVAPVSASTRACTDIKVAASATAAAAAAAATSESAALEDCCADGSVELPATPARTALSHPAKPPPHNFEDFIHQVWGAGIARHFAIPYNKKLWTVPLAEMETSWLGGRVPMPDLGEIIEGALEPVARPMGPNARFGYPLVGGFEALMTGFLRHIEGGVETQAEVVRVQPQEHLLTLADGRRFRYDHLVSTMPLPDLVRLIGNAAPEAVRTAAQGLRHISVRCVNLGIGRAAITDKHWIYYPEDTIFHRIFMQGNASPHCNPPGGFGFTCEISYSPWKPLPVNGADLIARCVADCIRVGVICAEDTILTASEVDMPYAYVVYDHAREANVRTVKHWLDQHDIVLAGRYSEWEYYNSDHAFIAGKKAAEEIQSRQQMSAAQGANSE